MKKLKLYSEKTIFLIIMILIIILSTVSYTLSTLTDANEKVKQDIVDFSRGAYDILIRPANARTEIEKNLNLVEENYLGIGDGGITIEQWQEIKNNPNVEIAAPVASIGLFTARERTFMLNRNAQDKNYYEIQYSTTDGVNTYIAKKSDYIYDFGNNNGNYLVFPSSYEMINYYYGMDKATFMFPTSYHQVVAISPEEEGKLTGFDFSPLTEKDINDYDTYQDGKFSAPVMSLADVSVPVTVKLTVDGLSEVSEKELTTWRSEFVDGNEFKTLGENPSKYFRTIENLISKKRLHQEEVYEFDSAIGQSPFKQNFLYLDGENKLSLVNDPFQSGIVGATNYYSQRIGYRLEPVVYEIEDEKNLKVKQSGVDEYYGVPTYRNLQEFEVYQLTDSDQLLNEKDFFGLIDNGTFSIKEKTELSSTPLGIYGREMPYLASDSSIKLQQTAVPGSFITTPAHGLISIDWAEKVKGSAPIDAIRVKVAGITGYDEEAATLIHELADEWEAEGFTVDIVAGASLQDLTVDVEGIGKVVQSFTTLGAADTVVSSWNVLQVVLTILYGLVAITFVGFTFFNLMKDRQKDEELLAVLGWSQKVIRRIRYKEWATMLVPPIVLVAIGFTVLGLWKHQWLPLVLSIGISVIVVILFILAVLCQSKKPKQQKKGGKTVTVQNIWFYRFNILASCIQLFFTTILTCFLPFFLLNHVKNTTKTRLGSYIHGEIEGLFIVVIILLYVLSLITVYQSLSRLWKKRESEIQLFLYLGWEKKAIRNYFSKEVLIWAGIATAAGWIVSQVITGIIIEMTTMTVILGIVALILIIIITLGAAIFSLHRVQVKGGSKNVYRNS